MLPDFLNPDIVNSEQPNQDFNTKKITLPIVDQPLNPKDLEAFELLKHEFLHGPNANDKVRKTTLEVIESFKGDRTKDFYEGMITGIGLAGAYLNQHPQLASMFFPHLVLLLGMVKLGALTHLKKKIEESN